MQKLKLQIIQIVLAFAVAMAPALQVYASPTPAPVAQQASINERIKVWASNLKKVFKFKNAKGEVIDAAITVTVVEGNDEVQTVGEIMDHSEGDVLIVHDESDQPLVERIEQSPNAARIQEVQVQTPASSWKERYSKYVGARLEKASRAVKGFFNLSNESFRGVLVSAAGNAAGFGVTLYFTNETVSTGAALSGIVFATGVLQNSDLWFKILHAGSETAFNTATGNTRFAVVNKIMTGLRKYTVPHEDVIRRTGKFLSAVAFNMIPTSMVFAMTDSYILSAGMLFASLRNSWDAPLDITIHGLLEKGRVSYVGSKRLMQVKSFVAPILDNAAASNVSVNGFPIAQVLAFTMAGLGGYMMYFTDHAERQYEKSKPVARAIATKGRQAGLAVVHSFGGGRKKARAEFQARLATHTTNCQSLLANSTEFAVGAHWQGRHARTADDVN